MNAPPWAERMPWAIPAPVLAERRARCEVCDPGIQIKAMPWPLEGQTYEACGQCGCRLTHRLRTSCPQQKW